MSGVVVETLVCDIDIVGVEHVVYEVGCYLFCCYVGIGCDHCFQQCGWLVFCFCEVGIIGFDYMFD